MSLTTGRPKRSRWPLITAILAPPIVAGAILVPTLINSGPAPQDMWVGATSYGPSSTAPAADIQVVHNALHNIGAQCLETDPDMGIIAADVDEIIAFSARYPTGRFPIDDETATASSLLLVTERAVKNCAPQEIEALDAARSALP
ncbi:MULTISPECIES: hypothetical protein [Bacteria]